MSLPLLAAMSLVVPGAFPPADARATSDGDAARILAVRVIGHSVKGRPIKAYRVGDPTAARKVVVIGAMHGDERAGEVVARALIARGAAVRANLWVVVDLNPDGAALGTRGNARGVDLNRNFPVDWRHQTGKYYSGPRPASEPETRAVMRFLGNIRPRFVISFHQPLAGVDTSYGKSRNLALRLAEGLGLPRKVFNCNSGCHGTMTQWFNRRQDGAALTVEYGWRVSAYQANVSGPAGVLRSVWATRLRTR